MEADSTHNDHDTPHVHLDWAPDGLSHALKHRTIVVIVDVLRFSTAVTTAVAHGFTIYPVSDPQKAAERAAQLGAELAGKSGQAEFSISPSTYLRASASGNKHVVLYSPNGAACSEQIGNNDTAYIGCFLNALAVGQLISAVARAQSKDVTMIAAGEQRAVVTGERITYQPQEAERVFAIEDYLGAGAILGHVDLTKSAEAYVCEQAYQSVAGQLLKLVRDSFSGRYLEQHDLLDDVHHAVKVNTYSVVPVIRSGYITALEKG